MKEPASSLTVTLIQTALHWENIPANLDMFEQKIGSITEKTEVVILPEMFTTGFSMNPSAFAEPMDGPTVQWMKRMAATKKIILTGSVIIEEGGDFYNRLIWMLPTGEYGYYDKRHLFGYAGEDNRYTAGHKRLIASVKGWKVNLQICYDLRFPVWARQSSALMNQEHFDPKKNSEPEYDLLINVANWPERRNLAWKTLLQARAIENQCYVAGVNRVGNDGGEVYHSGDSMIIGPLGEILYHSSHKEDVFTYSLQWQPLHSARTNLPFLKDADPFMIGI